MKNLNTKSLVLGLSILILSNTAFAITGKAVMEKMRDFNSDFIGSTSTMTMTLIDAHKNKVQRIMEAKLLEDEQNGNKSITTFIKPLDVKGTKLLTWTAKVGNNKQYCCISNGVGYC